MGLFQCLALIWQKIGKIRKKFRRRKSLSYLISQLSILYRNMVQIIWNLKIWEEWRSISLSICYPYLLWAGELCKDLLLISRSSRGWDLSNVFKEGASKSSNESISALSSLFWRIPSTWKSQRNTIMLSFNSVANWYLKPHFEIKKTLNLTENWEYYFHMIDHKPRCHKHQISSFRND